MSRLPFSSLFPCYLGQQASALAELSHPCEAASCAATQRLTERAYSLPYSQEPTTDLYTETNRFSPHHPIISKIHFNNIYTPMFWSFYWSLSFWPSHQHPICIPPPHSCYMPCPSCFCLPLQPINDSAILRENKLLMF
jgi:hypothetical protein